jgi:hypothetical protein
MEEKLTYEILEERFKEQDRLIAEGKMKKPKIIYGFSDEGQKDFDNGKTLDEVLNNLEEKYGKI